MSRSQRKVLAVFLLGAAAVVVFFHLIEGMLAEMTVLPVQPVWIAPFVLLLLSIAVVPFINKHWWEKNYPAVVFVLGALAAGYYVLGIHNVPRMLKSVEEYVSFLALIGSLYVVSGGIHLKIAGKSSPLKNVMLLAAGALFSNILGTTGASMVLIRPYLRENKYRFKPYHVVFFIFLVSNVGGALTPIGDPPLFLGYLKGVPFFWVIGKVWMIWLLAVVLLLVIFYLIDSASFRKLPAAKRHQAEHADRTVLEGEINFIFLAIILAAVFIERPLMLREFIMAASAMASYFFTRRSIHEKNDFSFGPIKEVAILFAGIFVTMVPALDWLELNAHQLGIVTPAHYYWGSGALSSFLDNAPTYLNFVTAAFGLHGASLENPAHVNMLLGLGSSSYPVLLKEGAFTITQESWRYVQAVSVAAVFFGACTYIGNGPNFMVKSIAEQTGVETPSFFGYIVKYTIPVLLPVFTIVWLLFFR